MVVYLVTTILVLAQNLKSYGSGFDAYTSCYRISRQRPDVPCDFASQNWCTIPGSSYPWHAVRRFVHENQGLMRRMYGDERHISVLRAEIDKNDLEYFYDVKEEFRERYSKELPSTFSHAESRNLFKFEKSKKAISHNEKNENYIGKAGVKVYAEPTNSFADLSKSTPLLTLKPKSTPETTTTTSTSTTSESTPITTPLNETLTLRTDSPTESVMSQIELSEPSLENSTIPDSEEPTEAIRNIPITEPTLATTEVDDTSTTEVYEGTAEEEMYEDSVEEEMETEDQKVEEVSQKPPSILRLKGINACPVKEEVVAPFWANNTRGEVLALLNLYPFEQYVHWEKCSFENKQMFCRDGCRCEQQYRLHRLLAYDPNNECRGIFSDWFRFPSCCICKCYDVPMEFRLTSRSPRSPTISDLEPGPT